MKKADSSPKTKAKRKPYLERTDLEKIKSQWTKLQGLHGERQWSAAVMRAATAAEIAANLAIRAEFKARSEFDTEFVDGLLLWANGLQGKIDRLIKPLFHGHPGSKEIGRLCDLAKKINGKRNLIAHSGHFSGRAEAADLIGKCEEFVVGLVGRYEPGFALEMKKKGLEGWPEP